MINRTRAWRRRKTRKIVAKVNSTKEWLMSRLENRSAKKKAVKDTLPHRPGKLTPAQNLRQAWATKTEMKDGFADA